MKITDIIKKVIKHDNDVVNLSEQLDKNSREFDSKINNIIDYNRIFKPKFGTSAQWGWYGINGKAPGTYSYERIVSDVDSWLYQGMEEISITIHTNCRNGVVSISEDIDLILRGVDYAINKGLIIRAVKVHCNEFRVEMINNIGNTTDLENQWLNIIDSLADSFEGKCDLFIVLNEADNLFKNSSFTDFIIRCLGQVKLKGFKAGVVTENISNWYLIKDEIKNNIDFISTNYYPSISAKGLNTSIENSICAISNSEIIEWIDYCYNNYPNKEIIITETGCEDREPCLLQPWIWSWGLGQDSMYNGEVQRIFLEGLFNVLKDNEMLSSVWYWYPLRGDNAYKTVKKYIGGGR